MVERRKPYRIVVDPNEKEAETVPLKPNEQILNTEDSKQMEETVQSEQLTNSDPKHESEMSENKGVEPSSDTINEKEHESPINEGISSSDTINEKEHESPISEGISSSDTINEKEHESPISEGVSSNNQQSEDMIEQDNSTNSEQRNSDTSRPTTVNFESLTDVEKDYISAKLIKDILQSPDRDSSTFLGESKQFVSWLKNQLTRNGKAFPITSLLEALKFLEQKGPTVAELFEHQEAELEPIPDSDRTYFECYTHDLELFDKSTRLEDHNIHAMAAAALSYIRKNFVFFSEPIFHKICEVYRNDSGRDFVIARLPFVLHYRDVFNAVLGVIKSKEQYLTAAGTNEAELLRMWADVLIRKGSLENPDNECDFVSADERVQILKDLLKVDFFEIPLEFYKE